MTKENTSSTIPELGNSESRRSKKSTREVTKSNSTLPPLSQLLYDRLTLEDEIVDAEGEITDAQDLIWRNQEITIKDKIDAYGEVLSTLEADIEKLKYIKREAGLRVKRALTRTEATYARLKQRLNLLSAGSPLRGHTYAFHPYQSEKREVLDMGALSSEQIYLHVEIKESDWKVIQDEMLNINFSIKKRFAKVSDLPSDHPALMVTRKPSVRIT